MDRPAQPRAVQEYLYQGAAGHARHVRGRTPTRCERCSSPAGTTTKRRSTRCSTATKIWARFRSPPVQRHSRHDLRAKYDVVIMYDFSRDLDEKGKKNLRDFVESGKGVVVLHHALLNYQKWNWWYQDVVGGSYRLAREGNVPSSTVKNDQDIFVTPAGQHPITAGIEPFHVVDETYGRMWLSPGVRPLLTTDNPNSNHVLAWIGPQAGSKVVAIQLGHGPTAFRHPSYRALVHNAIGWAAGRIQ